MQKFTLASLRIGAHPRTALGVEGSFYQLSLLDAGLDAPMLELLRRWPMALQRLAKAAERASGLDAPPRVDAPEVLTPVLYPDKLLAVGANYTGHLHEMHLPEKKWDSMPFFLRPPTTSLVGPGRTVRIPATTKQFDWEVELAVVLGASLRNATQDEAHAAIAGYSIGLDLSCRDLIQTDTDLKIDLVRGKAQDTMAPCGPWIVPAAFVPDPHALRLQLAVNGVPMQDGNSREMLWQVEEQLAEISRFITLAPGDILFTGSPAGSAASKGVPFLKPGDRIRAAVEGIGVLEVELFDAAETP